MLRSNEASVSIDVLVKPVAKDGFNDLLFESQNSIQRLGILAVLVQTHYGSQ